MTLNEAMIRHNFITKVVFKDGDESLSKELKIKLMNMRIELGKVRKEFDDMMQELVKEIKPSEFDELAQKEGKTDEEETKLVEMTNMLNREYEELAIAKGQEQVSFDKTLTIDEYYEIVSVNCDKDVEINGATISAPEFLEVLHSLFVAQ